MTIIKVAWFRLVARLAVVLVAVVQVPDALSGDNLWRPGRLPSTTPVGELPDYTNPNDGRPHTWMPDTDAHACNNPLCPT